MRTSLLARYFGGVVFAGLLAAVPMPTRAATAAGAQLVLTGVNGSLTAGSTNLSYYLQLSVTSPGTLTARVRITGRSTVDRSKWRADFPGLTNAPVVGIAVVPSAAISIPANFQGTAKMNVRAYYNGRRIGKSRLLLTIGAPVVAPVVPPTTLYDVGFAASTNLNANIVDTTGMTGPFTYAWKITDTDIRTNATLTGATTATPTLTTLAITNFPINVDFVVEPEAPMLRVGIDTDQVEMSTYHVRCIVTDSLAVARTGTVTVVSTSVCAAQQSIPIGERQYFSAPNLNTNQAVVSYLWTFLGRPTNSTAALTGANTQFASFRPDLEGEYTLNSRIILSNLVGGVRTTNNVAMTVKGARYVGVATCASCHGVNPLVGLNDKLTPWSQTGHATFAQRGIDGLVSPYYNESCLACHTVGYNKSPLAANGGFDDVQQTVGWQFPVVKQLGNFAAMPAGLRNLSNISCESCHGPGSQHPGPASTSLDVAVCATCHQDGHYHTRVEQWERSPHSEPFFLVSEEEGVNPSCAKCHSTAGFVDYSKGLSPIRAEAGMLSCQGCHDPHNANQYPKQVRFYDSVFIDDSVATPGFTLTGQGTSATCMSCHHARRSPPATYSSSTTVPHGGSTATDVLLGIRASTNVQVIVSGLTNTIATVALQNSAHSGVAKCVDCHMYPNPAIGAAGHNTRGDHTFSVVDTETGEGNIAACQQCHEGVDDVTDLDHISVVSSFLPNGGDYDGDGTPEGVQSEVEGVQQHLRDKMLETGMVGFGRSAVYTNDPIIRAVQRNAAWNDYLIYRDLSHGIHNTAFAVRLLQWSYTVLSTNTGGNAYSVDFPNADQR